MRSASLHFHPYQSVIATVCGVTVALGVALVIWAGIIASAVFVTVAG